MREQHISWRLAAQIVTVSQKPAGVKVLISFAFASCQKSSSPDAKAAGVAAFAGLTATKDNVTRNSSSVRPNKWGESRRLAWLRAHERVVRGTIDSIN